MRSVEWSRASEPLSLPAVAVPITPRLEVKSATSLEATWTVPDVFACKLTKVELQLCGREGNPLGDPVLVDAGESRFLFSDQRAGDSFSVKIQVGMCE